MAVQTSQAAAGKAGSEQRVKRMRGGGDHVPTPAPPKGAKRTNLIPFETRTWPISLDSPWLQKEAPVFFRGLPQVRRV